MELRFYKTKLEALAKQREFAEATFLVAREYPYHTDPSRTFYRYGLVPISNLDRFVELVRNHDLHLNEIIPHETPVRMYYDIEQYIDEDEDWHSQELLRVAFLEIADACEQQFQIELCLQDFIVTTSSRQGKLSFHMVCKRDDVFFSCNSTQRAWTKWLVQELRMKASPLIYSYNGQEKCAIDSAVYNVDQVFRISHQSKVRFPGSPLLPIFVDEASACDVVRQSFVLLHLPPLVAGLDKGLFFSTPVTTKQSKKRVAACSSELQNDGPRLYDSIPKETWARMGLIEKHVFAIPNRSQAKDIWISIGRAIKIAVTKYNRHHDQKIDGLSLFQKWSALSDVYTGNRYEYTYNSFFDEPSIDDSELMGLPFLIKTARECSPELFSYPIHEFEEYFNINYDGIRVIKETCPFVSDSRYEEFKDDIFSPEKFIVIDAYLGKGKTTAIKRLVKDGVSVLILSTRVTFAKFIAGDFGFDCYIDGDKYGSRRLVCSVESLLKVTTEKFDLVILDESESILSQFCSITLKGLQVPIWNKMVSFIRQSSKTVLADAFLTRRTFDFVRGFPVGQACLIQNSAAPQERVAIELSQVDFMHVLVESLHKGEKDYICYSTIRRQKDFLAALKTKYPEEMDRLLIYNSQVSDENFDSLDNMNIEWQQGSVCTTPTFTIGASFSPKDRDGNDVVHFDNVFLNLYPSCTVRDIFQTHMRVRHLKSNKLFFCLPTKQEAAFAKSKVPYINSTLEDFQDSGAEKFRLLLRSLECFTTSIRAGVLDTILENIYRSESIPDMLRQVIQFNLFEQAMSITHYNDLAKQFLKRCNYTVSELIIKADRIVPDEEEFVSYSSIYNLSDEQIVDTRSNIARKEASLEDKLQSDKYWFKKLVVLKDGLSDGALTECFHKFYRDNTNRQFLLNTSFELKDLTIKEQVDHFISEIRSSGCIQLNKSFTGQKQQIEKLNSLLGIASSVHTNNKVFDCDRFRSLIPYIESNKKTITNLFGFRNRSELETPQSIAKFLDSVYYNWNGTKMKVARKVKKVPVEWTLDNKFFYESDTIEEFF